MTKHTTNGKAIRKAKAEQTKKVLSGPDVELAGEIITWRASGPHQHKDVVQALKDAGLDEKLAKEFLPRNAFSRACKTLSDERVIDITSEDKDEVVFQFSRKHRLEDKTDGGQEIEYRKEVKVALNKTTGILSCKDHDIKRQAQAELDRCMVERTTTDITNIVQKLFDQYSQQNPTGDLLPVRDQGGAYFVLMEHCHFVDRIQKFLEDKLGGRLNRWPVPKGTQHGARALQDAVDDSMTKAIEDHIKAVESFDTDTRQSSLEACVEKVNMTKLKIQAYAGYLGDKVKDLQKALKTAEEMLVKKVEEISNHKAKSPPVEDRDGRVMIFGQAASRVFNWMGGEGWSLDEALKVSKHLSITSLSESTIKTSMADGRNPKYAKPCALTDEQKNKLREIAGRQ